MKGVEWTIVRFGGEPFDWKNEYELNSFFLFPKPLNLQELPLLLPLITTGHVFGMYARKQEERQKVMMGGQEEYSREKVETIEVKVWEHQRQKSIPFWKFWWKWETTKMKQWSVLVVKGN